MGILDFHWLGLLNGLRNSTAVDTVAVSAGRGNIVSTSAKTVPVSASLRGRGNVFSTTLEDTGVSAIVRERGAIVCTVLKTPSVSGFISGRGSVYCADTKIPAVLASTTGRGNAYAATAKTASISASLSGRGSVSASNLPVTTASALCGGRGNIVCACARLSIWYADINNSYVAVGLGTKVSPWNKLQLEQECGAQYTSPPAIIVSGIHTVYVKGRFTTSASGSPAISGFELGFQTLANLITVDIDPDGDLVPWCVDDFGGIGPARNIRLMSSATDTTKLMTYKNGVVKDFAGFLRLGVGTQVDFYNCHFSYMAATSGASIRGLSALAPMRWFGCTVTGMDIATGGPDSISLNSYIEYTDCVIAYFNAAGAKGVYNGDATIIAKNSVHTDSFAQFSPATDGGGNQFSWLPALESVRESKLQGTPAVGYVTLDAGASTIENYYSGDFIEITGGTGVGQKTKIRYNNSADISGTNGGLDCRISSFPIAPDSTSTYKITRYKMWGTTGGQDPLDFRYLGDQYVAPRGSASEITATASSPFTDFEEGLALQGYRTLGRGIGAFYFLGSITTGAGALYPVTKKTPSVQAVCSGRGNIKVSKFSASIRSRGTVFAVTAKKIPINGVTTGSGMPFEVIRIGGCCDYSLIRLDEIEALIVAGNVANSIAFNAVLTSILALSAKRKKKADPNDDHKLLLSIQGLVLDLEKKIRRQGA
jgi:hypothetical protein